MPKNKSPRPKNKVTPKDADLTKKSETRGRPKKVLNHDNLKALMSFWPSVYDVMGYFDISRNALDMYLKEQFGTNFRTFRQIHMANRRLTIQRKAFDKAEEGDNGMIYFTLKNVAGWKDDPDSDEHEDDIDELEFVEGA